MHTHDSSDTPTKTRYFHAWLIFFISGLFYAFQFILEVSPDAMGFALQQEFVVSEHRLGMLTAAFFLSYTVMQIPAGILIDRFGAHRLLAWAAVMCSSGCVLFALAPHIYIAGASRLLIGVGAAFSFIGTLKLVANWFPRNNFTLLNGVLVLFGMSGGVLGEAPFVRLIDAIGWRHSMLCLAGIGFFIALLIALLVKNTPQAIPMTVASEAHSVEKHSLALMFKNKQLWITSLYIGLLSIVPTAFCSLYGVPFLKAAHGVSDEVAAGLTSLILIGSAVSSPIWGWISDRSKRRLPPMMIAAFTTPLLFAFIVYQSHLSLSLLAIAMFSLGFFACGTMPAFSIACEISKPAQVATALAFINSFDTIGGMMALPIIGRLLSAFTAPAAQGVLTYAYSDYKMSFGFLLAIISIPALLVFFIRETHAEACY